MTTRLSIAKDKLKFVLLEGIDPSAVEILNREGYTQVESHPRALAGAELIEAIGDAYFVGIRSGTILTEDIIIHSPMLAAIGCFCIGTNQVDLLAAARRGVPVF